MRTHTSNRKRTDYGQPKNVRFDHESDQDSDHISDHISNHIGDHDGDNFGAADGEPAWLPGLAEEQMLVNQALVERVFACESGIAALRQSEQQLRELLARHSANRDDERKRISRQLHDSLAQNLLALRIDIVLLHQQTTNRQYRLRDRIGAALDNVDITLRTVKELLGELRPACLELGLVATVEMELRKFMRTSGIACTLIPAPELGEFHLAEEEVLAVHGVLQECLNNVARHSLASRVKVELETRAHWLDMRIHDNGIGFDATAPRKPCSYGLLDLQERIGAAGGALQIDAPRGQGTRVSLRLPIRTAPADSPVPPCIG